MARWIRLLGLCLRALALQGMVAAPIGLEVFARLTRQGQPAWWAWAVALTLGCMQALGAPMVVGGFGVGWSRTPGAWAAVLVASLPLAAAGAWHFSQLVGREGFPRLGAWLALATIFALQGLLGFALGRLALGAWTRRRRAAA